MNADPCREDEAYAAGRLAGFEKELDAERKMPPPAHAVPVSPEGLMTAEEWRRTYFAAMEVAQRRIDELEAALAERGTE